MIVDSLNFKGLFYGPTSAVKRSIYDDRLPDGKKLFVDLFEYKPFKDETFDEIQQVSNKYRNKIFLKKEKTENGVKVEYHMPMIFLGQPLAVSKADDYEFEDLRQTPYKNDDKVKFECYC